LFFIFGIVFLGSAIFIIGEVLTFVVGAFMFYERYRNTLYLLADVFLIADLALASSQVVGVLAIVGYVLMYVALGDTINKLTSPTP
jgi:Protein of unknown function (DUF973).